MPTDKERRAAFAAVKEMIAAMVPAMFRGYITDDKVWEVSDAAVWAAEQARDEDEEET